MVTEASPVAVEPQPTDTTTVVDKPASTEQKGSTAAAPVAALPVQERQDIKALWESLSEQERQEFFLSKLPRSERKRLLQQLPPDDLLDHPGVKQRMHSYAQSLADRRANEWRAQQQAQLERERIKQADPLELGEELKRRIQQEEDQAPLREQLWREAWDRAQQLAIQNIYGEIGDALYQTAHTMGFSRDDWENLVNNSENFARVAAKLIEDGSSRQSKKLVEAEMKKLEARQVKEQQVEERAKEPSPEVGGGEPASSDQEFLAAFAAGRSTDFARAKRILGM